MIRNLLSLFFINGFITMCNLKKCFIYAWHFEYSCNTQSRLTNLFFATLRQIARLWQALLLCDNVWLIDLTQVEKFLVNQRGEIAHSRGDFWRKMEVQTAEELVKCYTNILDNPSAKSQLNSYVEQAIISCQN